ncbi:unnamed protein product, partial [Cylicostephanus goldi]
VATVKAGTFVRSPVVQIRSGQVWRSPTQSHPQVPGSQNPSITYAQHSAQNSAGAGVQRTRQMVVQPAQFQQQQHTTPQRPLYQQKPLVQGGGYVYQQQVRYVSDGHQQRDSQHQYTYASVTSSQTQISGDFSADYSYDNGTTSLNLAVPIREPSPEPVEEEPPAPTVQDPSTSEAAEENDDEEDGEIDIQIRNVVCNYTLPLHIDLRKLALSTNNVTFDRGRGVSQHFSMQFSDVYVSCITSDGVFLRH